MSETPRAVFEALLDRDTGYNRRARAEWLARFDAADELSRAARKLLRELGRHQLGNENWERIYNAETRLRAALGLSTEADVAPRGAHW